MTTEYIYLLQEREFIKTNEPIFKLGKSKQPNLKRVTNYPNGTKLLFQTICDNCDIIEKNLLKIFKEKYELQNEIGYEYFKGNYIDMIKDIYEYIYDDKIENYKDFKKYSNIDRIVITNKDNIEGYLKIANNWHKFSNYDKNVKPLETFLESNLKEQNKKINYEKIVINICDECYYSVNKFET